jgi:hypothetical protein
MQPHADTTCTARDIPRHQPVPGNTLSHLACAVAAELERVAGEAYPSLYVTVSGHAGAHSGSLWWIVSWDDNSRLRSKRIDLTRAGLGSEPIDAVTGWAVQQMHALIVQEE